MWRYPFLLLLVAWSQAWAAAPPRLALVISSGTYQSLPALPYCAQSGALVAGALRRAGWQVTELRDPTNGQMGAALNAFDDALSAAPGSSAMLYVCGYAGSYENRVFLLPSSASLARPTDVLTAGIVAAAASGTVARNPVAAGLVVFDTFRAATGEAVVPSAAKLRGPATTTALVVVSQEAAGPDSPTPAATALAAAVSQPTLGLGEAAVDLGRAVQAAGRAGFVQAATQEAWLQGQPAAPVASPPDIASEPAKPRPPEPATTPTPATDTAPAAQTVPAPPAPAAQAASPAPPVPAAPQAPAVTASASPASPQVPTQIPPPPTAAAPPASPEQSGVQSGVQDGLAALTDVDRRRVQLGLQRLGYYSGKIDGQFGPETQAAIRRYQSGLGLAATGILTQAQATKLLGLS